MRREKGLSQEVLGLASGIDRTFVGRVERGEGNPSYETLLRIARVLETRVSEIVAAAERGSGRSLA